MNSLDVRKYNIKFNKINNTPLQIGNGDFALSLDISGSQTFVEDYKDLPLTTMTDKLWFDHKFSATLRLKDYNGKKYMTDPTGQEEIYNLLRKYPFKFNLFRLSLLDSDNNYIEYKNMDNINQELDLYTGVLSTSYSYLENEVNIEAKVSQSSDTLFYSMSGLSLELRFLYPESNKEGYDINKAPKISYNGGIIHVYYNDENEITLYLDTLSNFKVFDDRIVFYDSAKFKIGLKPDFDYSSLESFWENDNGIIIDDEQMVNRMVLSKYLLKINSTGIYPPSEASLMYNNWFGKFHLEMHLIHSLWLIYDNHLDLLLKSFGFYKSIYESSKLRASSNGFDGIRVPKMTSPLGLDSPSNIGPLLVWQAPHLAYMISEAIRIYGVDDLIEYKDLYAGEIDFIISLLSYDGTHYNLETPHLNCCESIEVNKCINDSFELMYFKEVLQNAIDTDIKLFGHERHDYNEIISKIKMPKIDDGIYLKTEGIIDKNDIYKDHPTETFIYSYFKAKDIDDEKMLKTIHYVLDNMDLSSYWGWDFPFMGMAAYRAGDEKLSREITMFDGLNNRYLVNGNNTSDRDDLKAYLPANGAFLLYYQLITNGFYR